MRKKQSKDLTSNGNYAILHLACGRGGTGRRVRLRGVWETVWVQVPSTAPFETSSSDSYLGFFCICVSLDLEENHDATCSGGALSAVLIDDGLALSGAGLGGYRRTGA